MTSPSRVLSLGAEHEGAEIFSIVPKDDLKGFVVVNRAGMGLIGEHAIELGRTNSAE